MSFISKDFNEKDCQTLTDLSRKVKLKFYCKYPTPVPSQVCPRLKKLYQIDCYLHTNIIKTTWPVDTAALAIVPGHRQCCCELRACARQYRCDWQHLPPSQILVHGDGRSRYADLRRTTLRVLPSRHPRATAAGGRHFHQSSAGRDAWTTLAKRHARALHRAVCTYE